MKKIVVCMCAVVLMVLACLVPCSAETWEEINPTYGLPFTGAPTYSNGRNNTEKVIEIVEKATALGMFGGMHPVQIYYQYDATNENTRIMVAVPAVSTTGFLTITGGNKTAIYTARTINVTYQTVGVAGLATLFSPWVLYCLQYNGDWAISNYFNNQQYLQTSEVSLGAQMTPIYKRVATWSSELNEWVIPSDTSTDNDIIGWGANTTEFAGMSSIIEKYDEQIDLLNIQDGPPVGSYELNIASIFNGYFNGVRDIFNGFDINLFGINIIGVLIAVLVIAIVAFIVRKLWK